MNINKYRFHHKLLSFLKDKYEKYNTESPSKCCFTAEQLGKELQININEIEETLFSLKEFECVYYNKSNGFKITEIGIKKQLSRFFIYKANESIKSNIKDIIQIIIPTLSLIVAVLAIYSKVDKLNNEISIEIKQLKDKNKLLEKEISHTMQRLEALQKEKN